MRTFFALRHIGRVECVTDHAPSSHSRGGGMKVVDEGSWGLYFLGERRVIGESDIGFASVSACASCRISGLVVASAMILTLKFGWVEVDIYQR